MLVRAIIAMALLFLLGPFLLLEALYVYNVSTLRPLPDPAANTPLAPRVAAALWADLGGDGPPRFRRADASRIVGAVLVSLSAESLERDAEAIVAGHVAATHLFRLQEEGRIRGMGQWHAKSFFMTWWVLRNYTADQALAAYVVRYGHRQAARDFYGRSLSDLRSDQLAAVIAWSGSSRYKPRSDLERAREGRDRVLHRPHVAGVLTPTELEEELARPVEVLPVSAER